MGSGGEIEIWIEMKVKVAETQRGPSGATLCYEYAQL
jgi:hypothetical protein